MHIISWSVTCVARMTVVGFFAMAGAGLVQASPGGSSIEIVSPSHPTTFEVSGCPKISQRLSWDDKAGRLKGIVTYSTVPGSGDQAVDSAHPRTFVLEFPSMSRSAHDELYVEGNNRKIALGHLRKAAPGQRVRMNQGVNFIAHRVEGRIGGEIIVSPAASTAVMRSGGN